MKIAPYLVDLEFCYSPPYNAALDPLHGLGSIALNREETGIAALGPIAARGPTPRLRR